MSTIKNKLDSAILAFIENNKITSTVLLKYFDFEPIKKNTAYVYFDNKSNRYRICISEDWIDGLHNYQVAAIIEHEVSHALLRHLERKRTRDKRKWNIAADLFINETNPHIIKDLKDIFPDAVWLDTVTLKEDIQDINKYTVDQLYELLEENEEPQPFDEHLLCKEDETNPKEMDVLEEMVQELGKCKRHNGEGISNVLLAINQKAKINHTIKRILNSLSKTVYKKSNTPSPTHKRRSRRLPQYAFIKGRHKKTLMPYVLVGIDTSGSMYQHEQLIQNFLSSLKNYNIQYDLTLGDDNERLFIPQPPLTKKIELRGYGETNLSFIDRRFNKNNYDGVVIFTDGYLPNPPQTPQKKTILVLTEPTEDLFNGFKTIRY
ncbi:MAG: hypothetical protein ABIM30_01275 [candidate division WOR-3 bacterium]